ncbi:MAG: phosphate acyltransferase PlsX [Lentihominibacter sp.]|jgi:glycerol-3-phosphate acyltransferase PlsX
MRVILDGMGGDYAPEEIVKGAVEATGLIDEEICIVGLPDAIEKELRKNKYEGNQIKIIPATETISMEDSPVKAIRRKTDSSLVVAMYMLKGDKNAVLISAGNTGALAVGARMILGRITGMDRPALACIYPSMTGEEPALLCDAGASSESKAQNLLEYAIMGSIFMEKVWGISKPTVGLVNLGVEESKGTSVTRDAYQMLKASHLNFIGNIEARELPDRPCDVIVCDGFTGNVILKLTEGMAISVFNLVKGKLMQNIKTKMAAIIIKKELRELKGMFDYEEYGGAPILGVNGPVIKIHGASTSVGVKNAIIRALPFAKENVVDIIQASLLEIEEIMEEEQE